MLEICLEAHAALVQGCFLLNVGGDGADVCKPF